MTRLSVLMSVWFFLFFALAAVLLAAGTASAFVPPRRAGAGAGAAAAAAVAPSSSAATASPPPFHHVLVRLAATPWDADNNQGDDDSNSKKQKGATGGTGLPAFDFSDASDKIQRAMKDFDFGNIDLGNLNVDVEKLKGNVLGGGPLGERGEAYFAAQAALVLCVVGGGVPLVGDLLVGLLGPGLLLSGLAAIALAFKDLGSSLSPWPVPPDNAELMTDGLYQYVRHPMYAGLLAACAGLSIVTGSATRLLLTALLLYVLDVKSDYEEDQLRKAFPGSYEAYRTQVTNKFFPQELLDQLPWAANHKND